MSSVDCRPLYQNASCDRADSKSQRSRGPETSSGHLLDCAAWCIDLLLAGAIAAVTSLATQLPARTGVPRLWTDEALAGWALPIAGVKAAPKFYTEAEYLRRAGRRSPDLPGLHQEPRTGRVSRLDAASRVRNLLSNRRS